MTTTLTLERREPGVAVVWIDVPGQPVNTLHRHLADEFTAMLDLLERDDGLQAVVLASGKPDGFVAGADLKPLLAMSEAGEGESLSRLMQSMTGRLAGLDKVTVAAIHGDCLGGGLEIALACDARVASDGEGTRLGLPEVQLGLLPGGGGTQRLARLVGLLPALDMMLTGRRLNPLRCRALGLVDVLEPEASLVSRAEALARELVGAAPAARARLLRRPMLRRMSLKAIVNRAVCGLGILRRFVLARADAEVRKRTRGLYPAPPRILAAIDIGLGHGLQAGLDSEAKAFGELCVSDESRALVSLFFASTALKKEWDATADGATPAALSRVGIIGAGLMGAGIARVSVERARVQVFLRDREHDLTRAAVERVGAALDGQVRRARISVERAREAMSRLRGVEPSDPLAGVELVIEAVFEDLDLKRGILDQVEREAPGAIFASNTSALSIADIARDSRAPGRVIGMHYFSPVERMPLLEVVRTPATDDKVVAACVDLGRRQGKTVVVVNDAPGFYTTRILAPYLNEAARLVSEGVPVEAVDEAMLEFGFPVGPLALLDEVGIDVAEKVAMTLADTFGERMLPPAALAGLVSDRRQGRKNGRGFYRYKSGYKSGYRSGSSGGGGGGARPVDDSVYRALGVTPGTGTVKSIVERCALLLVNEAVRCLDEGVTECARDGDVAAVFGLGFPPFRGGPFRYADQLGVPALVSALERLASEFGPRFEPASKLRQMAGAGEVFHGPGG